MDAVDTDFSTKSILRPNRNWRYTYLRRLRCVDALVIAAALTATQLARFGFEKSDLIIAGYTVSYWVCGLFLGIAWYAVLGAWDSRKIRVVGSGSDEFKLVLTATAWLFGTVAVLSYVFHLETARGYLLLALPLGIAGIVSTRWIQRKLLHKHRNTGGSSSRVLVVAGHDSAIHLIKSLSRQPSAGLIPVAAHIPGADRNSLDTRTGLGTPLAGTGRTVESILDSIVRCRADAVALSSQLALHPHEIRDLGWALADRSIRLIMAPALTNIAGPRIHVQPVAGMPLLHVSTPHFSSGAHFAKRLFDAAAASLLIIVLSPLFALLALLIKSDRGPVFFRQTRVGLNGEIFKMIKFRSMAEDADRQLQLLQEKTDGNGVLFKMKDDPRVTKIGKYLRRFSLDELPQLFNVFLGDMSLVGPRPPLETEVEVYEKHVHRRFIVKPGITGLWQVSGRSNLSWQDTVRLDLYYVENWSFTGDLVILFRTFRAAFRGDGAY